MALVEVDQFEKQLDATDELMALLRMKESEIKIEDARTKIMVMFGPKAIRRIKLYDTLKQVLRNPKIWLRGTDLLEQIAVVDPKEDDKLIGLTSRDTLVESLFAAPTD